MTGRDLAKLQEAAQQLLDEILDTTRVPTETQFVCDPSPRDESSESIGVAYSEEEDAEIQQRLADLGYL